MTRNPVEANPVTRFVVGVVVITAMFAGGAAGGRLLAPLAVPYADLAGVLVGALVVFGTFSVVYARYDARVGGDRLGG